MNISVAVAVQMLEGRNAGKVRFGSISKAGSRLLRLSAWTTDPTGVPGRSDQYGVLFPHLSRADGKPINTEMHWDATRRYILRYGERSDVGATSG